MPHWEQMVGGKFTPLWVTVVAISLFCLACSGGAAPDEPENLIAETPSVAVSTQETPEALAVETPNPPVDSRLPTTEREAVPEEPTAALADTPEPVQTTRTGELPIEPVLQLPNVADTVERARPAVVSVLAEAVSIGAFGRQIRPSTGTGVVISKDGFVLTNNHVVEGAQEVIVTLDDGTLLDAELVGTDRLSDLAVLRLPTGDYSFLPLTSDIEVRVGEWVIAIGNALAPSGWTYGNRWRGFGPRQVPGGDRRNDPERPDPDGHSDERWQLGWAADQPAGGDRGHQHGGAEVQSWAESAG